MWNENGAGVGHKLHDFLRDFFAESEQENGFLLLHRCLTRLVVTCCNDIFIWIWFSWRRLTDNDLRLSMIIQSYSYTVKWILPIAKLIFLYLTITWVLVFSCFFIVESSNVHEWVVIQKIYSFLKEICSKNFVLLLEACGWIIFG